ncbi:hypothetical protein EK21DRAFT_111676 [Setomelanomma holmii]|uniref:Uncharacterized protein n=1 Tax=Setomelanomma holmii TaxID=210430 RepID=A0A9P4LMV0_9PLEO|nr:hypothetical protein EK21DRAFT_111676 [Setomelanomma holmii]
MATPMGQLEYQRKVALKSQFLAIPYDSIKALTKRIDGLERVDAVLLNVGMASGKFTRTKEGEELIFATNTLGTVLLGLLVLPKLRESAKKHEARGRLVFTGSESYLFAQFNESKEPGSLLAALRDETAFKANVYDRYMTSKLLLLYAVRELASRSPLTSDTKVIITTTTPGLCWSGLYREMQWFILPFFLIVMAIFARSTEVGGRLLVDALRPDFETDAHGAFLTNGKPIEELGPSIEKTKGREVAKRFSNELFQELAQILSAMASALQ